MMDLTSLLSSLLQNSNLETLAPIIKSISENGFDLGKILSAIDINTILPLISSFFSGEKKQPVKQANPLTPVLDIADKEIVFALNRYITN